jgi:hypothetical protein
MSKIALTAGQLAYWRKRLGANATTGQIQTARQQQLAQQPAAPNPADNPPLPFDPVYEQTVASVNRNLGISDAELDYQGNLAKTRFGIEDQSDPFSRQALLNEQYKNAQNATRGSFAARGQRVSSAHDNAQGQVTHGYEVNSAQLGQQYQDLLHELAQRRINTHAQGQDTTSLALAQSLQNAISTPPDPMEAPLPAPKKPAAKKSSMSRANLLSIARSLNLR